MLVEAACRLDPPRLRRVLGHLQLVADPDGADRELRAAAWPAGVVAGPDLGRDGRGGWVVGARGRSESAGGVGAAGPPSRRQDTRSGSQRRADALAELARRALEGGRLPQTGGVRPAADGDRGPGQPGWPPLALWAVRSAGRGRWTPEACRRLACDGALTRVLVTRHPSSHRHPDHGPRRRCRTSGPRSGGVEGLGVRLRTAMALLPPVLGGAPTQPLEVGRASRVVQAAQRTALAVRDGGCVFPGCARPLAWCEAHHLRHWLHGGPTDLANLALVCRAHHRAVHEGGWRLARQADGRLTATPPHRPSGTTKTSHRRLNRPADGNRPLAANLSTDPTHRARSLHGAQSPPAADWQRPHCRVARGPNPCRPTPTPPGPGPDPNPEPRPPQQFACRNGLGGVG